MKKQEIIPHWGHFTLTLILAWLLMPSLSYAGHQASEGCKNRTSLEAHLALKMCSSVHELKGIKTFTRSDQKIVARLKNLIGIFMVHGSHKFMLLVVVPLLSCFTTLTDFH